MAKKIAKVAKVAKEEKSEGMAVCVFCGKTKASSKDGTNYTCRACGREFATTENVQVEVKKAKKKAKASGDGAPKTRTGKFIIRGKFEGKDIGTQGIKDFVFPHMGGTAKKDYNTSQAIQLVKHGEAKLWDGSTAKMKGDTSKLVIEKEGEVLWDGSAPVKAKKEKVEKEPKAKKVKKEKAPVKSEKTAKKKKKKA